MDQSDKDAIYFIGAVVVVCFAVQLVNVVLNGYLLDYGLLPRHLNHAIGLFAYPFIHGSWAHLFSNMVSFSALAYLVSRSGVARLISVFMISWAVSGVGVWLFGRMHYHIGLSGIVYGLWAYLLVYAVLRRSLKSMAIALIVMFFYGPMLTGIIPAHSWISYESHLSGALAGVMAGYVFARRDKAKAVANVEQ
ncbi:MULTISPECIES: rhomboid family intramembrane serine protease [Photobacterium]|uniref:Protease n=1 Tax=Photobacterium halotolerans TaxID=265726 RepID=A0A0F5VE17_9GAMM|nr:MULTISPECIES: rhomboid family intramembrane serine protease [Photobacterium]KKD00374.1 protease [Photobacterium halotolerans]UIP29676.1 rhomboid family intramembrane serine protease [Photobacterium sp. TLY01]